MNQKSSAVESLVSVMEKSLLFLLLVIVIIRGRTTVQYEKVGD